MLFDGRVLRIHKVLSTPQDPAQAILQGIHEMGLSLAGLQVVQLSQRQQHNLERYTRINEENRDYELKTMRFETLYGAFNDSISHIALGAIIWFFAGPRAR